MKERGAIWNMPCPVVEGSSVKKRPASATGSGSRLYNSNQSFPDDSDASHSLMRRLLTEPNVAAAELAAAGVGVARRFHVVPETKPMDMFGISKPHCCWLTGWPVALKR